MKKSIITLTLILMSFGAFAQGGLFKYGAVSDETYYGAYIRTTGDSPLIPTGHGWDYDVNGQTGEQVPLGGGALLLIGFGAAYAGLRRKKQ